MGDKYNKWALQESNEPKYHYVGYAELVPNDYGGNSAGGSNNSIGSKAMQQSNSYQSTTKNNIMNKQTGSFAKSTYKESYSSGDVFKERSTGRVGYKDEYKTTKTFKVGDKSGYSEYQVEERYRRVDYGKSSSSSSRGKNSSSNNKYLK